MEDNNTKALFRPHVSLEITPSREGYVVRQQGSEETYFTTSLDNYEAINEAAVDLQHKHLLSLGFRPDGRQGPTHEDQGELLASGRHTLTTLMDAIKKLTGRYGFSLITEQTSAVYARRTLLKEEFRGGPARTYVYLVDTSPAAPLPLTKADAPILVDALNALRALGGCDNKRVNALIEALHNI